MPIGNKKSSAYFDKQATEHLKRFADFSALADKATKPASQERYREKARKERDAAIDSLEQAKILDGP